MKINYGIFFIIYRTNSDNKFKQISMVTLCLLSEEYNIFTWSLIHCHTLNIISSMTTFVI